MGETFAKILFAIVVVMNIGVARYYVKKKETEETIYWSCALIAMAIFATRAYG